MENKLRSIAFPNISTGIYGYPKKEASAITVKAVKKFIEQNTEAIDEVIFVCFDDENYSLYKQILETN